MSDFTKWDYLRMIIFVVISSWMGITIATRGEYLFPIIIICELVVINYQANKIHELKRYE